MAMFEVDREALIERITEVRDKAIADYDKALTKYEALAEKYAQLAEVALRDYKLNMSDVGSHYRYGNNRSHIAVPVRMDQPLSPMKPSLDRYERDLKLVQLATKPTIRIKVEDFGCYL